jgi:hypothetical protein
MFRGGWGVGKKGRKEGRKKGIDLTVLTETDKEGSFAKTTSPFGSEACSPSRISD